MPDLLCREFSRDASGRAWISDVAYVRAVEGWVYVAVVVDLCSRRLLGYQFGDRVDTRLVVDAVDMAGNARCGRTGGETLT